ncbi:MAG: peptidylprolyl isomerase [Enterobacteriaceae bacterium]
MMRRLLSALMLLLPLWCATSAVQAKTAPRVELTTSLGVIEIELDNQKAPISAGNFIDYVNSGFYKGTIFHRVVPGFVIQGGGFTDKMEQKTPKAPIKNEADNGLRNLRGTLSMARTNEINSATSQFFINLVDNPVLDHSGNNFGYAVFGRVIKGMDVVDKIAGVATHTQGPYEGVPDQPVVIISAKVIQH